MMTYALGVAAILASYWMGGWYWSVVYAAAVIAQRRAASFFLAIPLIWVALFAASGDRRLFFPFAMYQAVVFGIYWQRGFAAGAALIVGLFTLIRIEQEASFRVIAVELVVAVVAVSAGGLTRKYNAVAAAGAASLIALAGLLL